MKKHDVVIIGAGPYGLSIAAHLQGKGIDPYVIGRPMSFWKDNMPTGMMLRSSTEASNINSPNKDLSIYGFEKAIGRKLGNPIPIEDFIAFGEWFQANTVPNLDRRIVNSVSRNGAGFNVSFADGDRIVGKQVVLALGIGSFKHRPDLFASIPAELAPHTSEFRNASDFKGQRVAVIGKGQSGLESAALLSESGAEVDVIVRAPEIEFIVYSWRKHIFRLLTGHGPLKPFSHKVLPPTNLGTIMTARKIANPESFRSQPPEIQQALLEECWKPIGAYWLPERLKNVRIRKNLSTTHAELSGKRIKLTFNDGSSDVFDRVVIATGYAIDMERYPVIDESLKQQIRRTAIGYPVLSTGLETSVDGLYMVGVIGERTLGPTLRFVTGTSNAGPRLATAVVTKLRC